MEQLKLNMIPNGVNPVFHASQYDKGRQIRFVLDETLSSAEVTVSYRAKDGTEYGNVQMSVSGNTITDTIPEEVLTDYGIIEGEVNIDGIGSLNFFVEAEKDAYDGGVITTQTATGAIATFETNIETAFVSLKTDINPYQDLHGYSKPWSGGGGKNKYNATINSLHTSWDNGIYTITSLPSSGYSWRMDYVTLPAGNYILNGGVSVNYRCFIQLGSDYYTSTGNDAPFTLTEETEISVIGVIMPQATIGQKMKPMIRLASVSDASFEPYSNICPISGFSALNVARTGKNLFRKGTTNSSNGVTFTVNDDGSISLSGTATNTAFFIAFADMELPNGTYTLSGGYSALIAIYIRGSSSGANILGSTGSPNSGVINTGVITGLIRIQSGTNTDGITLKPQLEVGNQATTFEPYNGQTATVNFGQTVYGGVADITNGKVNKTHALTPLNNKSWVKSGNKFYTTGFDNAPDGALYTGDFACAIGTPVNKEWNALSVGECCLRSGLYSLNKWSFVYCTDAYSTVEEFVSALNADCTITYPLATPIEITTTPENLTAIVGQNNVYSDTNGDTEVEYYIEV